MAPVPSQFSCHCASSRDILVAGMGTFVDGVTTFPSVNILKALLSQSLLFSS